MATLTIPRLGVAAAVVLVAGLGAIPAVGQGSATPTPVPATGICPKIGASTGNQLAGFSMSANASGFHLELDSKGLLPTGDAEIGNIIGADVPFTRISASGGPLVDALSSPAYPGDTAAHLGTIFALLANINGIPNDPVLAEADFPASPGHTGHESFNGGDAATAGVANADSKASESGGTASSTVTSTNFGGGIAVVTTASSESRSAVDVGASCVDSTATATTSGIHIAGVLDIAGVTGYAATSSDGVTGAPKAELRIGHVSVATLDAYIDRDGVHLASQQPVGAGVVATVESTLQRALAASGITIKVVDPFTTHKGGAASADSGALVIDIDHMLPGIGNPPAGTPPIPTHTVISYGRAQVAIAANAVPFSSGPLLPDVTPTSAELSTPPPIEALTTTPPPSTGSTPVSRAIPPPPPAAPGTQVLASNAAIPPSPGSSVPMGWLIIGIVASIIAVGPLLGYARWQLLEGRI